MSMTVARPLASPNAWPERAGSPIRFPVEPVIQTMHACMDQPLSLNELAMGAGWSAFHFHRLFRMATGIPPNEFLTILRLQRAKRLLLTTSASVTDICFEVGYASLGTFTARFTNLVGISPGRLRQFANTTALPSFDRLSDLLAVPSRTPLSAESIGGTISAPAGLPGPIFVGLFPKPIPQARPVAGTVLTAAGRYQLAGLPDGRYYLLAAELPWAENPRVPTLAEHGLLVGNGSEPLLVQNGHTSNQTDIVLRPPRLTDPPVLTCLPFLLTQRLARATASA